MLFFCSLVLRVQLDDLLETGLSLLSEAERIEENKGEDGSQGETTEERLLSTFNYLNFFSLQVKEVEIES